MQIFLTAAFSSGKSSLSSYLADNYQFRKITKNAYRSQYADYNAASSLQNIDIISWNRREFHTEYKDNFFIRQSLPIMKFIENSNKNGIFDRCLVDSLVYFIKLYQSDEISEDFYNAGKVFFEQYLHLLTKEDSLIVYLPIEFPIVPDGYRPVDEELRKLVDTITKAVLLDYNLSVLTVSGSIVERAEKIVEYYNNKNSAYELVKKAKND